MCSNRPFVSQDQYHFPFLGATPRVALAVAFMFFHVLLLTIWNYRGRRAVEAQLPLFFLALIEIFSHLNAQNHEKSAFFPNKMHEIGIFSLKIYT